jgi:hypothetical protein
VSYGDNNPNWMDAQPVRDHVHVLGARGIGQRRVCALSGVSIWSFRYLMYGAPNRGYPPSRKISAHSYLRIMSVSLDLDHVAAEGYIDATITRRKLEAMVAMGWSQKYIASRLGVAPGNSGKMFRHKRVSTFRARQVRDLFNELWDKRPKRQDGYYYRELRYAERRGYVTALAWNDIEDLNERHPDPYPLYPRTFHHTRADAMADVLFLRRFGESEHEISKRVHVSTARLKDYA